MAGENCTASYMFTMTFFTEGGSGGENNENGENGENTENGELPTGGGGTSSGSTSPNEPKPIYTAPTIPIKQLVIKCLQLDQVENANLSVTNWINHPDNNYQVKLINSFLNDNNCSPEAQAFVMEAIEAILNNEVETFEEFVEQENEPCANDPVPNPELVSSGASGKRGGTYGCTRTGAICNGESGKKMHNGIDIKANINTNTYAMYSGTISGIRNTFTPGEYKSKSYGNYVQLTINLNGNTYFIKYNHLNNVSVVQGQEVNVGDIIGLNGNTGNANPPTGKVTPHIHIQVFDSNWNSIDPAPFLGTQFDNDYNAIENPNC